jgi:hypothetical protein
MNIQEFSSFPLFLRELESSNPTSINLNPLFCEQIPRTMPLYLEIITRKRWL